MTYRSDRRRKEIKRGVRQGPRVQKKPGRLVYTEPEDETVNRAQYLAAKREAAGKPPVPTNRAERSAAKLERRGEPWRRKDDDE